jgi:hypothetical protein
MRDSIISRPVYAPLARARSHARGTDQILALASTLRGAKRVRRLWQVRPAAQQVLRVQFADGYAHSKGALTTLHEAALWDGHRSRFGTNPKRSLPAEALPAIYFFALGTALA